MKRLEQVALLKTQFGRDAAVTADRDQGIVTQGQCQPAGAQGVSRDRFQGTLELAVTAEVNRPLACNKAGDGLRG